MKKSVLIPYERYVFYKNLAKNTDSRKEISNDIHSDTEDIRQEFEDKTQPVDKLNADIILTQLPKRNRAKAEALLNVIDQNPNLDWNKRGELLINKDPVPFSHITDILHDALNNTTRSEPVGCEAFYSNLQNIPLSLINNPRRRALVGGRQLPPPGIPDKKPIELKNWKVLWKNI